MCPCAPPDRPECYSMGTRRRAGTEVDKWRPPLKFIHLPGALQLHAERKLLSRYPHPHPQSGICKTSLEHRRPHFRHNTPISGHQHARRKMVAISHCHLACRQQCEFSVRKQLFHDLFQRQLIVNEDKNTIGWFDRILNTMAGEQLHPAMCFSTAGTVTSLSSK